MGISAADRRQLAAHAQDLAPDARDRIAELALASARLAEIGAELAAATQALHNAGRQGSTGTAAAQRLHLAAAALSSTMRTLADAVMEHAQHHEDMETLQTLSDPVR